MKMSLMELKNMKKIILIVRGKKVEIKLVSF